MYDLTVSMDTDPVVAQVFSHILYEITDLISDHFLPVFCNKYDMVCELIYGMGTPVIIIHK